MLKSVAFLEQGASVFINETTSKVVFDCYRTDHRIPYNLYRIDFEDGSYTFLNGSDEVFVL